MYKYEFEFKAKMDNMYTITPLSDILLFNPPSLKVFGVNDCHSDIASFIGDLGKVKDYMMYNNDDSVTKTKAFTDHCWANFSATGRSNYTDIWKR
jgi:hypothetical protein